VQFALELYLHRHPEAEAELVARARAMEAAAGRDRVPLTFLRSIFLPGDEVCFLVFESCSAEAVAQAARDGQIAFERVVEARLLPDNSPAPSSPRAEAARATTKEAQP